MKKSPNGVRRTGLAVGLSAALFTGGGCAAESNETPPSTAAPETQQSPPPLTDITFPGRVALPIETCELWGNNPGKYQQKAVEKDGMLLTVVDARFSPPVQCDPNLDTGAGTYSDASYDSPKAPQPDGAEYIADGTAVQIVEYRIGEFACNQGGGSRLWLDVKITPDGQEYTIPSINAGSGPPLEQLQGFGIPEAEVAPEFKNARTGGC